MDVSESVKLKTSPSNGLYAGLGGVELLTDKTYNANQTDDITEVIRLLVFLF